MNISICDMIPFTAISSVDARTTTNCSGIKNYNGGPICSKILSSAVNITDHRDTLVTLVIDQMKYVTNHA